MMKPTLKAVLFIALLALSACNTNTLKPVDIKEIEGFDYGRIRNNTYANTFFNLKMDIPKGWVIQDDKQKKELMQKSSEELFNDEKMKAAIKASEIKTANLLIAFAHEPGTVAYNNNLVMLAENVQQLPYEINGADYLANANKLLSKSKMEIVQIDNSFPKKTLNGMDFYQMNLVAFAQGMHIHQTYLATIDKGFALCMVYSYADDTQKAEIEKAINSLRPYKK